MSSRISTRVRAESASATSFTRAPGRMLLRKCTCGGKIVTGGECAECRKKRLQTKLTVNQPGDRFEQEADRMAEFVVRGGNRAPMLSNHSLGAVQREEPKAPPKPDNYDEAISKILDALKETPVAKQLQAKAAEMGKDFAASVEGKVIIGSSLGGALAAIIATNSKLPMQIPELPLDFIAPGLKAKITWEGPVQQPTNAGLVLTTKSGVSLGASYTKTPASGSKPEEQRAGLSLTIPLGGSSKKKKGGPTASEKYRAETARIAAEQEQFRAGMKTPGKKNDDKDFVDSYVRSKVDPTNPLGLPPLKKKEDLLLMRKAPNESSAAPATVPPIVDEVLQSSGEPLEPATRALMETRFGYDFGNVRIHRGARADESAKSVNALAWTFGRDVVFAADNYVPTSTTGRRLIAHELTHVVQQSSRSVPLTAETIEIGPTHDACEEEAEACATRIATGVTLTASRRLTASRPWVQRFAPFEFIGDIFTKGPGEAFVRLFGEGEFSEQELLRYLGKLDEGETEGRYDSDNKARAVVRLWKAGSPKMQLNPPRKKLLIREMWQGSTSKGDAESILDLLERSLPEDVTVIFGAGGVTPKDLYDAFSAADQGRLQQFFDQRVDGGLQAALKGTVKPTGGVTVAPYLNDQTLRQRWLAGLDKGLNLLTRKIASGGCTFPRSKEQDFDKTNWMLDKSEARQEERLKFNRQGITPISAAPFQAVDLLFDNLDQWTCDCRLFGELAMLFAWHEALADSPVAFNNKFANLVLTPETTTGLEREVIATDPAAVLEDPNLDTDRLWKEAPVGTKVAWRNESSAAKAPFEFEHAIKTFHFGPGRDELYAAHPFSTPQKRDLTEKEIVDDLAQAAPDFPWVFEVTGVTMTMLPAEGVDPPIVKSLAPLQGQRFADRKSFLDAPPLLALRQKGKQDPPRFSRIIDLILKHTRTPSSAAATEAYIAKNIVREKIEIPK